MTRKSKNIVLYFSFFLLFLSAGLFLGSAAGRNMIEGMYRGKLSVLTLLYRPAVQFYETAGLINSRNELDRITGYYGLAEGPVPGTEYLAECCRNEKSLSVKKVIIWLMKIRGDRQEVLEALNSLCETASGEELDFLKKAADSMKEHNLEDL